jgi:hypothetical protein
VTLYRAEIPLSHWTPDVPVVFMTDKKQARSYMNHGRSLNEYQVKIDDIIGINSSSTDDIYSFIVKNQRCVFRFVRPPVPVSSGQAFRCDPASMI